MNTAKNRGMHTLRPLRHTTHTCSDARPAPGRPPACASRKPRLAPERALRPRNLNRHNARGKLPRSPVHAHTTLLRRRRRRATNATPRCCATAAAPPMPRHRCRATAAAPPLLRHRCRAHSMRARGGPSRERGVGAPGDGEESGIKGPQNLLTPSPERAPALHAQHSARLSDARHAAADAPPPPRHRRRATAAAPPLPRRRCCAADAAPPPRHRRRAHSMRARGGPSRSAERVLLGTVKNQESKGLKTC